MAGSGRRPRTQSSARYRTGAYGPRGRPVGRYPVRDPTIGLSGVADAQAFVSRMHKPSKKAYAQALLDYRANGGARPTVSGGYDQFEVERNLNKILNWPATQCEACRRRLGTRRGSLRTQSNALLCDSCDAEVPCVDCGEPRGSIRPAAPEDHARRDPRIDRRAQCAGCAVLEDRGETPAKVKWRRRRRRAAPHVKAASVALIAGGVVLLLSQPWNWSEGARSAASGGTTAGGYGNSGGNDHPGSGGSAYIGGGTSSGTGEAASGGTSYGPGLVPTFRCRDGSLSYAQHSQGACSHHGGIAGSASVPGSSTLTPPASTYTPTFGFCDDASEVCLDPTGLYTDPRAAAAARVLTEYYATLNRPDYPSAYLLLSTQRQQQISKSDWERSLTGMTYAHVHVTDFRTVGSGAVVSLTYLARWTDPTGVKPEVCRSWELIRSITDESGVDRIGPVDAATSAPCDYVEAAESRAPLTTG